MSMGDDVKYLEAERKKLWEEVTQLKKQLEQFQKQTPEQVQSVIDKTVEIDDLYSKITSMHSSIEKQTEDVSLATQGANDNISQSNNDAKKIKQLKEQSEKHIQTAETSVAEINNLLNNATVIKDDLDAIIADIKTKNQKLHEIDTVNETSVELQEKISLAFANVDKNYKDINNLHMKIFGYTKKDDNGEELKVGGLKDELDRSYSKLASELVELQIEINTSIIDSRTASASVKTHWEDEHASLKKKITDLLPGALTTGLSYAYKDKKDSEIISMKESSNSFRWAIIGLVAVSLIPFGVSIYLLIQGKGLEDVILKLPRMVMAILPLYVPVLWIAYSSSKKVNLSKRLIEEYSHKEALSKTFEGLSGQINNIKDSDEKDELKARLLYNLLEVSAENPGKLIYDYNNADHPLMDALDKSVKLSDAVSKIASIPGMSKLSNILVEKDKKIKAEIGEKVAEGLKAVEEI